jgi:HAD superfamily hydrolase (TIGR01509 family)
MNTNQDQKKPPKTVFWDLGHTLARQREQVRDEAVQRIRAELGAEITSEAYETAYRQEWIDRNRPRRRKEIKKVKDETNEHDFWWDFYICVLVRAGLEKPSDRLLIWLLQQQVDPQAWEWMPGAEEAIQDLCMKNIDQGMITNSFPSAKAITARLEIDKILDPILYSHQEGAIKPEQKIYRLACERAGVLPRQALLIDDRLDFCKGAIKAGMRAIWFNPAHQDPQGWNGEVIKNLDRVKDVIVQEPDQESFFRPVVTPDGRWLKARKEVLCQTIAM